MVFGSLRRVLRRAFGFHEEGPIAGLGEEELDSVIKDRAKLQRDRSAGSNRLDLSKPKDLIFYSVVLLYYGFVQLFPGCRYFSRFIARKPASQE